MKLNSREVGIAFAGAGVGAILVATIAIALDNGNESRSAAQGVSASDGAPAGRSAALRVPQAHPRSPGGVPEPTASPAAPQARPREPERAAESARVVAEANTPIVAAAGAAPAVLPREPHDALAESLVVSLGWRQEPEDAVSLGRWLERSAGERARVLAGYAEGAERAHAHNQVLKSHLAELRTTFGDLRAAQIVDRLRLMAMDPETGELYPVDVEGNAIDR
ncbi:MAG: hypothetical protein GC161_11535 [Planctomycetaceae bacterium]|nr:hypothetical protein [Planctomycetaceae bacterium]